jgi:hypothetical protein
VIDNDNDDGSDAEQEQEEEQYDEMGQEELEEEAGPVVPSSTPSSDSPTGDHHLACCILRVVVSL